MLHLTYDGVTVDFDAKRLTVKEARFLKDRTGLRPQAFWEAVSEFDGDAVFTVWALACARAGQPIADLNALADTFDLLALKLVDDEATEPDPTDPAPEGGTTGTTPTG
jgi:hypothetical protein